MHKFNRLVSLQWTVLLFLFSNLNSKTWCFPSHKPSLSSNSGLNLASIEYAFCCCCCSVFVFIRFMYSHCSTAFLKPQLFKYQFWRAFLNTSVSVQGSVKFFTNTGVFLSVFVPKQISVDGVILVQYRTVLSFFMISVWKVFLRLS